MASASTRRFLLCPPAFFDVTYAINPWMTSGVAVDRCRAWRQWERLRETYELLGHKVDVIDAVPGLPDMVFAANAGTVIHGTVLPTRFRVAERRGEESRYRAWFEDHGYAVVSGEVPVNEGEGDLLLVGDLLLAGTGFRSEPAARGAAQEAFGLPTMPLQLVDPRYYHLDTALGVLDDDTIAYYPPAFSEPSRRALERRFPDAVIAGETDALALGLNLVSDGRHVVLADGADGLAAQLADRSYEPIVVEMGEFKKSGGAVKCCTLELRS